MEIVGNLLLLFIFIPFFLPVGYSLVYFLMFLGSIKSADKAVPYLFASVLAGVVSCWLLGWFNRMFLFVYFSEEVATETRNFPIMMHGSVVYVSESLAKFGDMLPFYGINVLSLTLPIFLVWEFRWRGLKELVRGEGGEVFEKVIKKYSDALIHSFERKKSDPP